MDGQAQEMLANNRVHIPAVCRIPGRGTAFLVSPGLLLTSSHVVGSKQEASRLKAVFFEGGKQAPVSVDLQPYRTFFSSAFPDHLDYALVACDTRGIYNVKPVKLPLVSSEWADVQQGDSCLIVQHRMPAQGAARQAADDDAAAQQVKHFEEVARVRGELLSFERSGEFHCAGCPVFNARGVLIGLHTQIPRDGEGLSSRAVRAREVARHLFANAKIGLIDQAPSPQDVWETWHQDADAARVLRILQNFPHTETVRRAMCELRQMSSHAELVRDIMECGGAQTILDALRQFRVDEEVVSAGLRALWNVSFGDDAHKKEIVLHGGTAAVIEAMHKFDRSEEVAEYGSVLLFNISSLPEHVTPEVCEQGVAAVLKALETHPRSEVILKFALGVLMHVARHVRDAERVGTIVRCGGIERAVGALERHQGNEYLAEHAVLLLAALAAHPAHAAHPAMRGAIPALCSTLKRYDTNKTMARHGNGALWSLGGVPAYRVQLVRHGGLDVVAATIDAVAQTVDS